ncbi:MAG: hypothetical protein ACJ76S_13465 [Solirubrobacteraceae bacterium]
MTRVPRPALSLVAQGAAALWLLLAAQVSPARAAAAPTAAGPAVAPLDASRLGRSPVAIRDREMSPAAANRALRPEPGSFDGRYPVGDGHTVRVILSAFFPPGPALPQSVAGFMGRLVHGAEMDRVTVFLAPREEIALACGAGALACYSQLDNLMLVPAATSSDGISREEIIAHEYGHAVANARSNFPFPAIAFGTKRWATYEHVCQRVFSGPRPKSPAASYRQAPGEAFADSYRILNGGSPALWAFDRRYFPNAIALRAIRLDVLRPWSQRPPFSLRGAFSPFRSGSTRRFRIVTPLDGLVRLTLTAPPGANYDLEMRMPRGRPPVTRSARPGRIERLASVICGSRVVFVTVRRASGSGRFRLSVSRP